MTSTHNQLPILCSVLYFVYFLLLLLTFFNTSVCTFYSKNSKIISRVCTSTDISGADRRLNGSHSNTGRNPSIAIGADIWCSGVKGGGEGIPCVFCCVWRLETRLLNTTNEFWPGGSRRRSSSMALMGLMGSDACLLKSQSAMRSGGLDLTGETRS